MKPSQRLKVRMMTLEDTNLTLSDCSFKDLAGNTYIFLGILVYDSVNMSRLKYLKQCFIHLVTDTYLTLLFLNREVHIDEHRKHLSKYARL